MIWGGRQLRFLVGEYFILITNQIFVELRIWGWLNSKCLTSEPDSLSLLLHSSQIRLHPQPRDHFLIIEMGGAPASEWIAPCFLMIIQTRFFIRLGSLHLPNYQLETSPFVPSRTPHFCLLILSRICGLQWPCQRFARPFGGISSVAPVTSKHVVIVIVSPTILQTIDYYWCTRDVLPVKTRLD